MESENKLTLFQENQIRKVWNNEQWWFVIEDIVLVLTDSANPKGYIRDMRRRDPQLSEGWGQFAHTLAIETKGGKQKMNCANTEGVFRILMAIPSQKAEPLKQWLARVGQERIEEIENPELGIERIREIYLAKGYPDEWIERRLQTIEIRKQLTDEWKNRGIKEGQEYSILTAEIAKATFGLTPSQHKDLKGLTKSNENLRDHMTPLELIFTALGEEMTRAVTVDKNAKGFEESAEAAQVGGRAAGKARIAAEKETGVKVVSAKSYLKQLEEAQNQEPNPNNDGMNENK